MNPTTDRWRRDLWIPLGVATALLALSALAYRDWYLDDTFIYAQFARNLLAGNGFAFNVGEPVYAVTGALWVLLIALGSFITTDVLFGAKLVGVTFGIATLLLIYTYARHVLSSRTLAWTAMLLWAIDGWWTRTPFNGMESAAATCLVLAAILLRLREDERGFDGFSWSVLAVGIGAQLRPELHLLFGTIWLYRLLSDRRISGLFGELALYVAINLPILIWAKATFGTFIPTTFGAKVSAASWTTTVWDTVVRYGMIVGVSQGLAIVVLIVGLIVGGRSAWASRQHVLPAAWFVGLAAFYVLRGVGGFLSSRYLVMATPLLVIYGLYAVKLLSQRIRSTSWRPILMWGLIVALFLQTVVFHVGLVWPSSQRSIADFDRAWRASAEWIRGNTPPEARVASGAIGIPGYYSERYIIDLGALIQPEALPYYLEGRREEYMELAAADYLIESGVVDERMDDPRFQVVFEALQEAGMGLASPDTTTMRVYKIDWEAE